MGSMTYENLLKILGMFDTAKYITGSLITEEISATLDKELPNITDRDIIYDKIDRMVMDQMEKLKTREDVVEYKEIIKEEIFTKVQDILESHGYKDVFNLYKEFALKQKMDSGFNFVLGSSSELSHEQVLEDEENVR